MRHARKLEPTYCCSAHIRALLYRIMAFFAVSKTSVSLWLGLVDTTQRLSEPACTVLQLLERMRICRSTYTYAHGQRLGVEPVHLLELRGGTTASRDPKIIDFCWCDSMYFTIEAFNLKRGLPLEK